MSIRIITDTSCDLPTEILNQYQIDMIPLRVTFENGETYLDRLELSPEIFVQKMAASRFLPKTAAPDPSTFIEHFEKGLREAGEVLFVSLSSGLSSTYEIAQLAKNLLGNTKVRVFDTLSASLGTGIMAVRAAQMAAKGFSMDEIIKGLTSTLKTKKTIFTLNTLENVVKGGRLKKIEGLAGDLLHIKPIFLGNNENGKPELFEKVRGRSKAIKRMVEMLGELAESGWGNRIVGITHVHCIADAQHLAQLIAERYNPDTIWINDMSATIGTYAGEGGLMVNI
ncbi:MAG TPA: DegV family protein [Syntrophomonadaceae bacterium]|jgi:DegV family protein with EDD domain|nr:DegV family protein [Bacillota bacterium]HQD89494.1 DegV family protein [Syntrophomonadaceae bacterium]